MSRNTRKMSEADLELARQELKAWHDGERGRKLTWALLENALGFSRQTLSSKPDLAKGYDEAKRALRAGRAPKRPRSDDYLEGRVKALAEEVAQLKEREDRMLERWACIKVNAQRAGISWSKLEQPFIVPQTPDRPVLKPTSAASVIDMPRAKQKSNSPAGPSARASSAATGHIRPKK